MLGVSLTEVAATSSKVSTSIANTGATGVSNTGATGVSKTGAS